MSQQYPQYGGGPSYQYGPGNSAGSAYSPNSGTENNSKKKKKGKGAGAYIGWSAGLVVTAVACGVVVWQVDSHIYSAEASAEHYWDALRSGNGANALALISDEEGSAEQSDEGAGDEAEEQDDAEPEAEFSPDSLGDDEENGDEQNGDEDEDADVEGETDEDQDREPEATGTAEGPDAVLLDGEALQYSSSQIQGMSFTEEEDGVTMNYTVDDEGYETFIPMVNSGRTWLFFQEWELADEALTEVEVIVPGAESGAIGQVDVNEVPANLEQDALLLNAFVPTVVDIEIDSEWLAGSAREVITAETDEIVIDLEASDSAQEVLHQEVQSYLDECAEQEVLMPAGCPMGFETVNRVDSETINWDMPDASSEVTLGFDDNGWDVSGMQNMSATLTFESLDHHTGEELNEEHDVRFDLDVEVGASGDELFISVTGVEVE